MKLGRARYAVTAWILMMQVSTSAWGQEAAPLPEQGPATMLNATQFDLLSKTNGRTYRIFVGKPLMPPPPQGYPMVIVTDGNGLFDMASMQMQLRQLGELRPAMIIGVGYPTTALPDVIVARQHDLTPPMSAENAAIANASGMGQAAGTVGAAESFYRFLVDELRPSLAAAYPIDASDSTLVGDSLGGLFALHVLFNHPQSFRSYVAGSPSIWWNGEAILEDERRFRNRVAAKDASPRVLITVGGLEQSLDVPPPLGMNAEQAAKVVGYTRMVDNAREMAERLAKAENRNTNLISFHVFPDESHASVIPATISRALTFALGHER